MREAFSALDGDEKLKFIALYPDLTANEREDFLNDPHLSAREEELTKRYRSIQTAAELSALELSYEPQLKAVLHYRDGREVNVSHEVSWDIHPPLARINGDQLETQCANSGFVLSANFLNEIQSSTAVKTHKPLRSLIVSLDESSHSFQKTELLKLEAKAFCQDGTASDVSCQVHWASNSSGVEVTGCGDLRVVGKSPTDVQITAEYQTTRATKQIYLKR